MVKPSVSIHTKYGVKCSAILYNSDESKYCSYRKNYDSNNIYNLIK